MDDVTSQQLLQVWKQAEVPVLLRRGPGKRVRLRFQNRPNNLMWLRRDRRTIPHWNDQYRCWEVPKAWFNSLVTQMLDTFGRVYIIQPFREEEKCAPACWSAIGYECQCSCMGANHGSQISGRGWHVISETFAARWNEERLACRLLAR